MRPSIRVLLSAALFATVACGSPGTTVYSYCSDMAVVSSSCADAGQAAQCSSAVAQPFSGPTTVNGLSLDYCTGSTNDAGVVIDGGCMPPTFECIASGCKQPFDGTQVASCTL